MNAECILLQNRRDEDSDDDKNGSGRRDLGKYGPTTNFKGTRKKEGTHAKLESLPTAIGLVSISGSTTILEAFLVSVVMTVLYRECLLNIAGFQHRRGTEKPL